MKSDNIEFIISNKYFSDKTFWYQFGYQYGGPVALGYVQYIINKSNDLNIDSLLFVSRDGYILQKIYNIISENPIENKYIYAPRILNLKCFLDHRMQFAYLKNIMKLTEHLCPEFKKVPKNFKTALALYEKHKSEIMEYSKEHLIEYQKYFDSLNITGSNVAIVDMVSGAFTAQKFINKFLPKEAFGFYFATYNNVDDKVPHLRYLTRNLLPEDNYKVNLLEVLITAPEYPLDDIKNCNPVYAAPTKNDIVRKEIYKDIEVGILDFVKDYTSKFNNNIPAELAYKKLDKSIKDKNIKNHFRDICFSLDICGDTTMPIFGLKTKFIIIRDKFILKYIDLKRLIKKTIILIKSLIKVSK